MRKKLRIKQIFDNLYEDYTREIEKVYKYFIIYTEIIRERLLLLIFPIKIDAQKQKFLKYITKNFYCCAVNMSHRRVKFVVEFFLRS